MSFEEYGLSPELLNGLADTRIEQPTPLQSEVLPVVLQGKHVLVKTEADDDGVFLIPALQKIAENGEVIGTQVLILTPSIERASKIDEMIWAMGYHAQISSALLAMKGNRGEQEQAVLDGAPVIVANPGRLIEILEKNSFRLQNLKFIVIDEAHNMENFNLVSRIKEILYLVDGEPQTLILSSTQNNATKELVKLALKNPELIGFSKTNEGETTANLEGVQEATDVDLKEAEEKLKKAPVKVVLKKDIQDKTEEKTTDATEKVDLELAKEKLEIAEVEVILPSDLTEEANDELTKEKPELTNSDVNLKDAKEKLKKSSIKVVLKEDITDKKEEVEPVFANPILQGEALAEPVAKSLEQSYINVPPRMKISTLMAHLEQSRANKIMVFAASKRTTDRLFHIIKKKSWGVVSLSAGLDEETYNERFAKFTSGEMRICLIGGIEAKHVEINHVQEVINYDVPSEVEEYRYRAELVAKGNAAQIISLVSKMDQEDIARISKEVGYPPNELPLPEEVIEKKKKKSTQTKSKDQTTTKTNSNQRNSSRSKNEDTRTAEKRRRVKKTVPKKKKVAELPRPTYDGLTGGREGAPKSTGVLGWVKKLFT